MLPLKQKADYDIRERVEALPIRPIEYISHAANLSLKIHLLPNAGTDRNVRSFEYLAAPAVDQCIVRQCSSFLLSSNCFFTSQLVPFISRPDSGQIAFINRTLPACTFYGSGETKFSKNFTCPPAPSARQRKVFQPLTRLGDSRLRRSGKCDRAARAHWPVQRVMKMTFFVEPDVPK
jgi:hypothetical protein